MPTWRRRMQCPRRRSLERCVRLCDTTGSAGALLVASTAGRECGGSEQWNLRSESSQEALPIVVQRWRRTARTGPDVGKTIAWLVELPRKGRRAAIARVSRQAVR